MTLASRLKNRIEIYRLEEIETPLGQSVEPVLYKRVWADIVPLSASLKAAEAETERAKNTFKVIMRKTDIKESDFIKYNNNTFQIDYIIPNFNGQGYIEVFCSIETR
jgi:SPP1 family predicted phage head-tail adaptor